MSSLARVTAEVNESTGSAFLIAFQQHAARHRRSHERPALQRAQVEDLVAGPPAPCRRAQAPARCHLMRARVADP